MVPVASHGSRHIALSNLLDIGDFVHLLAENADECKAADFVNGALVAKSWTIPFLKQLWERFADFDTLLSVTRLFSRMDMATLKPSSDVDWGLWLKYGQWLTTLSSLGDFQVGEVGSILRSAVECTGLTWNEILPSLRTVVFDARKSDGPDIDVPFQVIGNPRLLRSLSLTITESNATHVLSKVPPTLTRLTNLELHSAYTRDPVPYHNMGTGLVTLIKTLQELERVVLRDYLLNGPSLRELACLKYLEVLIQNPPGFGALTDTSNEHWRALDQVARELSATQSITRFPSLRVLHLCMKPGSAHSFEQVFATPFLTTLSLSISCIRTGDEAEKTYETIYKTIASFSTLTSLTLHHFDENYAVEGDGVPLIFFPETIAPIGANSLRLLGHLSGLRVLNLASSVVFDFEDNVLVQATSNWPMMEQLCLEESLFLEMDEKNPHFSLGILVDLLKNMPKLISLSMAWKTEPPSEAPNLVGYSPSECKLDLLDPLESLADIDRQQLRAILAYTRPILPPALQQDLEDFLFEYKLKGSQDAAGDVPDF